MTVQGKGDSTRSAFKREQAYSGRAVEVQLAEQEATTAQYSVGWAGDLIGLFGSKEKSYQASID
jgi:hypothetical protein